MEKVPVAEYLETLLCELERLWPTAEYNPESHGPVWNRETQSLQVFFNIGDSVFPYVLEPGDIGDDPVATAARLAARGKAELGRPENQHSRIGFKR